MRKVCEICGGSGQISFFQGVSRFLLTCDECPECNGIGYKDLPADQAVDAANHAKNRGGKKKND